MFGIFDKITNEKGDFIMNTKFYLLYDDNNCLKFIDNIVYKDISEIDLKTIMDTKEDFIKEILEEKKIDLVDKNIVIAKVTLNKEKDYYNVSLYNPIFQYKSKINENRLAKIKKVILNRLEKVTKKEKIKLLDDNMTFKSLIVKMVEEILSNKNLKEYIIRENSFVNKKIKDDIRNEDCNYNVLLSFIINKLKSYYEFRNFLFEFIDFYRQDLNQKLFLVENYLLPSEVFDYQFSFFISNDEASLDMDKLLDDKIIEEDSLKYQKFAKIKMSPFDDEEIGMIFRKDGLSYVMEYFDGNRIYSSSKEDLLRIGIISDEEYLKRDNELKP